MREGLIAPDDESRDPTRGGVKAVAPPRQRRREGALEIDGSRGEGGGQILRTSLALAMITGQPLRLRRIRAGRARPGLRRQHLACVEAAARLCHAQVDGATLGSQDLEIVPGAITGGVLELDIGTAGSTTLVVQTILVPALAAGVALRAVIRGGTHNPLAPPFDYLDRVYLPQLRAMGADVELTLDRHGFANGDDRQRGQLTLSVGAGRALRPIELVTAGPVTGRRATVITARLPTHVAERELARVDKQLGFTAREHEVRDIVGAAGPANLLLLEVEREGGVRELITSLGEKHLRAETVAQRACDDLAAYLAADAPVGEHLADQLVLPLAVAGGGRFRAAPLSSHATTNIETIQHFLDVPITVEPDAAGSVLVTVG
jgi:RNA 3'-terminal phosphate cyclase (ATP)